jgi:small-conductance mechanosensitive channel
MSELEQRIRSASPPLTPLELADGIWRRFAEHADSPSIRAADFQRVLGKTRETLASDALTLLDVDVDGAVTREELDAAIARNAERRDGLVATLRDAHLIVQVLEQFIGSGTNVLVALACFYVFQLDVAKIWLSFSSLVVAFSFTFGNSLRVALENAVFLFVVHAFDVGDTIMVPDGTFTVQKLSLYCTVLRRVSDGQLSWEPNAKLSADTVSNLTRTASGWPHGTSVDSAGKIGKPPQTDAIG